MVNRKPLHYAQLFWLVFLFLGICCELNDHWYKCLQQTKAEISKQRHEFYLRVSWWMLLTADLQQFSQNNCCSSWSFSWQSLNMHSPAQPADRWDAFSLCCTDAGAAACVSGKVKALSWPECRGAWHGINECMALMSSGPQPWMDPAWQTWAWQPPAEPLSTTWDRCHIVSPAPPSSHHILTCSLYIDTPHPCVCQRNTGQFGIYSHAAQTGHLQFSALSFWAGQDLCCSLFGSLLCCLNTTATPFNFLSLIRVIFNRLVFYSNIHFYCIYLKSSSNHFRSVSWEIFTEDAGGKQVVLVPLQNKQETEAWSSYVLCKSHRIGNSLLTAHSSSSSLKARTGSSLLLFCFLGAFEQMQCSFGLQPSVVISALNYFSFSAPNCISFDCRELDKLSTRQTADAGGHLLFLRRKVTQLRGPCAAACVWKGGAAVTGG